MNNQVSITGSDESLVVFLEDDFDWQVFHMHPVHTKWTVLVLINLLHVVTYEQIYMYNMRNWFIL